MCNEVTSVFCLRKKNYVNFINFYLLLLLIYYIDMKKVLQLTKVAPYL